MDSMRSGVCDAMYSAAFSSALGSTAIIMNNCMAAKPLDRRVRCHAVGESNGLRALSSCESKTPSRTRNACCWSNHSESTMKTVVFFLTMLVSAVASAQQTPTTGYAPVNGLKMYYEVHGPAPGMGEPRDTPVVLLHGSFMTITNNWSGGTALDGKPGKDWIGELSKTRKVIAIEMQGHGRTADIDREFSYENLADDVVGEGGLLDYLKIPRADLIGYSMGGGVAMQCAIRHPDKVRKVVSISAAFRLDGLVKEALDAFPQLTAETFKASTIEIEYKKLSPTPDEFPNFVKRVIAMDLKPYDFGADRLKATKAPMFFIHGDADGVRLEHIAEMFRLKGDEIFGDLRPRSALRLAILPDTTHVTLMRRMDVIVPMVNDFLDAKPQEAPAPPQ
jgi:pimeloyl-ACP methyl ester carboxylesterase